MRMALSSYKAVRNEKKVRDCKLPLKKIHSILLSQVSLIGISVKGFPLKWVFKPPAHTSGYFILESTPLPQGGHMGVLHSHVAYFLNLFSM